MLNMFSLDAANMLIENEWTKQFLMNWRSSAHADWLWARESILMKAKTAMLPCIKGNESFNDISNIDFGRIDLKLKEYKIYAEYFPSLPRAIKYYKAFYEATDAMKAIVIIHERMHAYHHVNAQGIWEGFNKVSPVYLEFLAQLFTFNCVKNTPLENTFREMSKKQSLIYWTWTWYENVNPIEAYEDLMNKKVKFPILNELASKYSSVLKNNNEITLFDSLVKDVHQLGEIEKEYHSKGEYRGIFVAGQLGL